MGSKRKGPAKPNMAEVKLMARIAHSVLVKTRTGKEWDYSLANGEAVERRQAERLINNGWVVGNHDGLWPGDHQTFWAKTP